MKSSARNFHCVKLLKKNTQSHIFSAVKFFPLD